MYTFNPLASIPVDHVGFVIITSFCLAALILVLLNEPESFLVSFFVSFFILCFPVSIAYGVSYHWTNQAPETFANVQVTAEFAGYAPEGYREKSGKSYVDRHYVYVVYKVNGNPVLLQGAAGVEYPKTAILYKN
jgi:hypothetical protein